MFGLGMQELVIILIIILVLFGAAKLPELATAIGKAIKNFKKATSEPDEIDVTPKKKVAKEENKGGEEKDKTE